MTSATPDHLLAKIRHDIDDIDDRLIDLLLRRWAATSSVRALKRGDSGITTTPYRPAREAQILRRLVQRAGSDITATDLVRLWRVILSASISSQAPVAIHVDETLARDVDCRLLIAEQFCGMPVSSHSSIGAAIAAVRSKPLDLVIFRSDGPWADDLGSDRGTGLSVVAGLPALAIGDGAPKLLIAAGIDVQDSGDDLTLLLSRNELPDDLPWTIAWRLRSGARAVTAVAGCLSDASPSVSTYSAAHLGQQLRIAGVVPAPLKAKP